MSLFGRATVLALRDVPAVNARIEGDDFIQNHFYDIGVAVGASEGLVVPVLRDAGVTVTTGTARFSGDSICNNSAGAKPNELATMLFGNTSRALL